MASATERNPIRNRGLQMIPYGSHEEWLKIRKGYIGGSDAAAVVGLNPYSSAFSVWAEKTGKAPEFDGNISTRVGSYLEDLVGKLFAEETGKQVQRLNFTLVNSKYPWACANIDREIIGEDAFLEIKTTTSIPAIRKFRGGEYPEQWYGQLVHYLAVTGCRKAYLAALENNRELRIFELERDEEEIAALMDAEQYFWDEYVRGGRTPAADGHSATGDAIKRLFPEDDGESVSLSSGFEGMFMQRKALNEQIKALKEELDGIDNQVKIAMGSASKALCGRFGVTWKFQNTSGIDRERFREEHPEIDLKEYATQARVFRVTEKKERK